MKLFINILAGNHVLEVVRQNEISFPITSKPVYLARTTLAKYSGFFIRSN